MNFKNMIADIGNDEIETAAELDFIMWNDQLQEYPQALYDMLILDAVDLPNEEKLKRKAILDAAYVALQSTMEEITRELQSKYPNESKRRLGHG
ncbi:hypothetical protein [Paenibacillus donghaensis]|uniref:Uncharacterized protein n=1 Tax=Paenibacillus donghaensis TaxID=414771 RepID=A0A2Z2KQL4_9BACL|nr:hypothetical protein [Paenibacillus donghaensis]ASA22631.1 hypothetical protein B9T62_18665 [Paenibacillus donghaensis]